MDPATLETDPNTQTSPSVILYQGQWTRVKKKKGKKKRWVWVYRWVPVSSEIRCDNPCRTATLDPYSSANSTLLAANSNYLTAVTIGAKDEAGNAPAQNYSGT